VAGNFGNFGKFKERRHLMRNKKNLRFCHLRFD